MLQLGATWQTESVMFACSHNKAFKANPDHDMLGFYYMYIFNMVYKCFKRTGTMGVKLKFFSY